MASRAARDMASCMKTGGKAKAAPKMAVKAKVGTKVAAKHDDKAQDMAMLKSAVKPAALKKPQAFAVGGVAKARLGMASSSGKQARVTAPVKSQAPAPKKMKAMI